MAVAYQSGLLGDFYRRKAQQRALTGLPTSYQEQRGLLDPMLAYNAQREQQAGLLANQASQFDRQMSLQEKVRRDQATAGMVGGVGQLAMLPLAYGAGKSMGWWGGKAAVTAPTVAPVTDASITAAGGAFNAPTAAAAGYGLQTPGYTAPGLNTAQGSLTAGAAGTTAQGGLLGTSPAYTGATGTAAYGSAEGAGTAGVLGAEGGGLLGTAGTVAGPAALGAGAGMWGMGKLMGVGGPGHQGGEVHTANILGGIAGGAMAGAAATSWSGPGAIIGGVIGGIIGGISSLF